MAARACVSSSGRSSSTRCERWRATAGFRTNRAIAGELMVSIKTVEVHLTSVYTKLEVTSRTELRARARRGELEILDGQLVQRT